LRKESSSSSSSRPLKPSPVPAPSTIPSPVSSTQAVIGRSRGRFGEAGRRDQHPDPRKDRRRMVVAPVAAFVLTFISLFFVQNLFEQRSSGFAVRFDRLLDAAAWRGDVEIDPFTAGREFVPTARSVKRGLSVHRTKMKSSSGRRRSTASSIDSVRAASVLAIHPTGRPAHRLARRHGESISPDRLRSGTRSMRCRRIAHEVPCPNDLAIRADS